MKVTIEGNELVIRVPANFKNPPPSSTKVTRLVASAASKGDHEVLGKPLTVSVLAYIKA